MIGEKVNMTEAERPPTRARAIFDDCVQMLDFKQHDNAMSYEFVVILM